MALIIFGALRINGCKSSFIRTAFYSSEPLHDLKPKAGKVVNVAIIGAPNSGKSTLINKIIERKICAASNKVHTTTKMVRAICFQNDTQIIFLDTPGIVTEKEQNKYNLPESMIGACHKSLRCADVIGVVHDVSNRWSKDVINKDIVTMLKLVQDTPSFLIINKVDLIKTKKQLLTVIHTLTNGIIAGKPIQGPNTNKKDTENRHTGYSDFSDVFLVSALNGDGVTDIKSYLMSNAKPGNFQYSPEDWTDQNPETLIVETVRAKFLDFLAKEIPYTLKPQLEYYEEKEDKIICHVSVDCPSERLQRLISGAGGGRLQQIKSYVRNDLIDMFKKMVSIDIQLNVKSKEQ